MMAKFTKMLPLDNPHVKELTEPPELQESHEQYVKQMERTRDNVVIEICYEFKQGLDCGFVANRYFSSSPGMTKEPRRARCLNGICPLPFVSVMYSLAAESCTSC